MRKSLWLLAAMVAVVFLGLGAYGVDAQRSGGGGKGGYKPPKGGGNAGKPWGKDAGKQSFPNLTIEDVKPDGAYEVYNLLPTSADQPNIAVTADKAYRLVGYTPDTRALKFVTVDLISGSLGSKEVRLPPDAPTLGDSVRMAADGGNYCVISQQAATIFINPFTGKLKVAAGFDPAIVATVVEPKKGKGRDKDKDKAELPPEEYHIHGGPGGKYALSVLVKYDKESKRYTGNGATLHFAEDKGVTLAWDHSKYGVPPENRDAVCAVTETEIVVLVTTPRTPGAFHSSMNLSTLVFDRKGAFKEAQTSPDAFAGSNAPRFTLSPDGGFIVAHPELKGLNQYVLKRGTWQEVFKCDYIDPCVGFAPEGGIGVFLENKTPQRATLKAVKLATLEAIWTTTITHKEAAGDGNDKTFTSVGPGALTVAAMFGIIRGETADEAIWLYKAEAIDFEPLCLSYDLEGKRVAVFALDRIFVLDAKTREELHSVTFETPLAKGTLGEFVSFDAKGKKLMACARNKGVWLIDLATNKIEKTLPPVAGTWARAMPDFSGVVYSQPKDQGGNVMMQKIEGGDPVRVYLCEYKDAMAVCFWISDKGDSFLIAEREIGEGRLFLVNDKAEVDLVYNVADCDPMYVGDTCVTAFVTKKKQAVLINEVNKWEYTGINCTVVSPSQDGDSIETNFSAVFKSSDLPGRSTYGATAASPFFGGLYAGDERNCKFACPAGVLDVDIGKSAIRLIAWSRAPVGLAAINPKGKEFFVAGSTGLTTYKIK
jgi:hypothetical protein